MHIKVWTVATSGDNGLDVTCHESLHGAYVELIGRICHAREETLATKLLSADDDYDSLLDYLEPIADRASIVFNIEWHRIAVEDCEIFP